MGFTYSKYTDKIQTQSINKPKGLIMIDISNEEKMVLNTDYINYRIEKKRWFDRGVGDRAPIKYYIYATVSYAQKWRDTDTTQESGVCGEILVLDGFKLKKDALKGIEEHKSSILSLKREAAKTLLSK